MWWLHKLFTEFTEKVFRLFVCFYPNNNIYHKLINYNHQVNTLHHCFFFFISVYVPKPKGCSRCSMCMNGTYILGKTSKLKLYSVIYKLMLCGGELWRLSQELFLVYTGEEGQVVKRFYLFIFLKWTQKL